MLLFGDTNPAESNAEFEFGKDGKPFFVAGPHDTPERCRQILATLTHTCGQDQFHFMLPVSPANLDQPLGPGGFRLVGPDEATGGELEDLDDDEE
jgi:hypothetical protein